MFQQEKGKGAKPRGRAQWPSDPGSVKGFVHHGSIRFLPATSFELLIKHNLAE